jgi:hypothetical protein
MKTTLHHFAYNIAPGSIELVIQLFNQLGCSLSYRKEGSRWCLIKQGNFIIQLIETEEKPKPTNIKKNTHIGFISDNPEQTLNMIENWTQKSNKKLIKGSWSDQELWFDLPKIFVNFVVEIMDKSIIE